MVSQCAIRFRALAFWNFQFVAQIHRGDAEEFFLGLDAALDFGFQLVCCGDSARFQRACKCAGQSTGQGGDDVIDRGRQRRHVFYTVIIRVSAVHAEVQRLLESFNVRFAERPLFLHQPDARRVNDFAHECLPELKIPNLAKSFKGIKKLYLSY
jgi:hypothetical protein